MVPLAPQQRSISACRIVDAVASEAFATSRSRSSSRLAVSTSWARLFRQIAKLEAGWKRNRHGALKPLHVNPSTSVLAQPQHGACSPVWLVNQRSERLRIGKCSFNGQTLRAAKIRLTSIKYGNDTVTLGRSPTTIAGRLKSCSERLEAGSEPKRHKEVEGWQTLISIRSDRQQI